MNCPLPPRVIPGNVGESLGVIKVHDFMTSVLSKQELLVLISSVEQLCCKVGWKLWEARMNILIFRNLAVFIASG